jgi:hypothetical protein
MSLKLQTYKLSEIPALTEYPLGVYALRLFADQIIEYIDKYRPEYACLVRLQRKAGNRITEMFQPERWTFPRSGNIQIQPQKGNATRVLSLRDIGFDNEAAMRPVLADMARLPKGQYERAFSKAVQQLGLWRLYDSGFCHPSTHFFRHLKIKELKSENFSDEFIANWIGEKQVSNLEYYFNSQFFAEVS